MSQLPQRGSPSQYNSLQDGEIRLLQVHPLSDAEKKVKCTLTSHGLSLAPTFSALSYTWGLPHPQINSIRKQPSWPEHQIECNGWEVRVGENLFDFLLDCASNAAQHPGAYFWIDALCINQSDLSERCEQVKIMSKIYQKASGVIVWLGPEDEQTETAVKLMFDLCELIRTEKPALHPHELRSNHSDILLNEISWHSLHSFFQRSWFNRAWVIQEVAFAKHADIWCGRFSLTWQQLEKVSHFLATSVWSNFVKTLDAKPNGIMLSHHMPTRVEASRKTWLSDEDDKFLFALLRARSTISEDPRDKVFSQLGLGKASLPPDYTLSITDVYISAAKYIIDNSSSLLLLTCVEGPDFQTISGLPSWVPDWTVTENLGLRMTGYFQFHAASNLSRWYKLSTNGGKHILSIKATMVDRITKICKTKSEIKSDLPSSGLWEMVSKLKVHYAYTGESRTEAVWRTLMTNRQGSPSTVYPASAALFAPSFRAWVLSRYVLAKRDLDISAFRWTDDDLPTLSEITEARDKYMSDKSYLIAISQQASLFDLHYSHAMFIRPFCTKQGYFGMGTQCLREDDSVWIVPGCRVPLVLRPVEGSGRYKLVGGSYLHGVMNGELMCQRERTFNILELE